MHCTSVRKIITDPAMLADIRNADGRAHDQCAALIENMERMREVFAACSSLYAERRLYSDILSHESLVESLVSRGSSHSVLLPTKVSAGRSLCIAEFNIFGMLYKLCLRHRSLEEYRPRVLESWEQTLFMLLSEEVYGIILEKTAYSPELRKAAASRLIDLWEERDASQSSSYSGILSNMWRSRKRIIPAFGTMLGTFELMRLSSLLSDQWHEFLSAKGRDREMIQAVEEFIFGLTFEQITRIRESMKTRKVYAVNRCDISGILGTETGSVTGDDPRAMYLFFQHRAGCASGRVISGSEGPCRTIEEMLLAYILDCGR